ncbi:serine/threonine protein phosphatase [Oscillatoriales cyanobacterium USR001]|nr:serine/threonine protein phosphatase [Oscillatoriales cyanobacterium USR001]
MQNALPKHYLWAVGEGIKACRQGDMIAGRYLLKRDRILIDTQPEKLPEMPEDIPVFVTAYLRLFPHRLHIPEVYGVISRNVSKLGSDIWLLENSPLSRNGEALMLELASAWPNATPMRQLNWLWQIAQLWQPCSSLGVASTLLNPHLLRVEGPLVRVLELQPDQKAPSLAQLGQLWQQWAGKSHRPIANFLQQLSRQMTSGQLQTAEQLISQLDQALVICGRELQRTIHIATGTHTGPTRSHNEDSCYPPGDTAIAVSPGPEACAIVCDGIGGQDGGEVASLLAVSTLRDRVKQILQPPIPDQFSLTTKLERSACLANDAIAGRNDTERRQHRQRMGTTLVMAIAHLHELYITHVGDSRAYWITRHSCRQITLDDDVACREVRLGYALYRDALQQVAAGALVQALGITSSATLHPTVQRFPLDEDCIFLLCSDGLSDKDRIEEYWETEILPILDGATNVANAKDRLIEIANTRNGHDNVTVALLYCQVTPKAEGNTLTEISIPPLDVASYYTHENDDTVPNLSIQNAGADSTIRTQYFPRPQTPSPVPYLVGIFLLLLLGGLPLIYSFNPQFKRVVDRWFREILGDKPVTEEVIPPSPNPTNPDAKNPDAKNPDAKNPDATTSFEIGNLIKVIADTEDSGKGLELMNVLNKAEIKGQVVNDSILRVMETKTIEQETWVKVKICSIPSSSSSKKPQENIKNSSTSSQGSIKKSTLQNQGNSQAEAFNLSMGQTGFIKASKLKSRIETNPILSAEEKTRCKN